MIVADGEWGRVGEITLSDVVLDLWDDRRLVLPCTYFTSTPYQNGTRHGSELLGSVEFDLHWRVSPQRTREHVASVVVARLQDEDVHSFDPVHEPVLGVDAA